MVKGIGCDIIEIDRIRDSIKNHGQHFLDKIFTKKEQSYCLKHQDSAPQFAARFAAKEAVVKALGTGFNSTIGWLDIEIVNNEAGKPEIFFSARASQYNSSVLISVSHCRTYAMATAVLV